MSKKDITEVGKTFSKNALVSSKMFQNRKDILNVIINQDENLTIDEVNKRIDLFMKGKVD